MKIYILCYSSEEYGNGEPEVFKTYIDAENAFGALDKFVAKL